MINLYELIEASNGQLFGEPAAQLFNRFCLEADDIQSGDMFVVLQTERGDMHQYMPQVIAQGAAGIICTRPPDVDTSGVSVVYVRDTVEALLAWSQYILGKYGTKVIGVTGSAGKSVAVSALNHILGLKESVYINLNTGHGRLSVPLALAGLRPTHRYAVLRLDATEIGEMAALAQAAQPEVVVITDIGEDFTAQFESADQVAEEIRILVDYLPPSGLAVLNYDDDRVRQLGNATRAPKKTFSIGSFGADMIAYDVQSNIDDIRFDLRVDNDRYTDRWMPLLGEYSLYSVMASLLVGMHFGVSLDESLPSLTRLQAIPGRMNRFDGLNDALVIDDTYNANPQSTLGALKWLNAVKTPERRLFLVLGDMEDLGINNTAGHRRVGQQAAEVVDVLITRGIDAAVAARAALDHGMDPVNVHTTYANRDVLAILTEDYTLSKEDVILVKGGIEARMEQVVRALLANESDHAALVRQKDAYNLILSHPARLTWVEIDYTAIAENTRQLKTIVGDDVALMAVVKADAYGHGAVMTAQTALRNGATYLGVSSVQEATEIREAGITAPILAMNYTPPYMVRQAIRQNVTLTLFDLDVARDYDRIAREVNREVPVHVKIDTGMGRLGVLPGEAMTFFRHILNMSNLNVEGVYTHFSMADVESDFTDRQLQTFKDTVRPIQSTTGYKFKYIHACNSAGALAHPQARIDMVRPGIALYGLHPSDEVMLPAGFRPALTWKTIIAQVKTLPAGHAVGYGNTYITEKPERIAVLPVGYGDGFRRAPTRWREVLIHGQRAPLVGRVSMEKTMVNVDHIPGATVGDEVVLIGKQGDEQITAEDVAAQLETINYEVTCNALPRLPRR
jgi:Alr-MurF fusion protein